VVSLHATLTDESRHLIGAEQLARMRPGAVLVNCARGGLVKEKALLEALKSGTLGGAALDVFEDEPQPEPELVGLPNVIATPHVAASTEEAQIEVATEAARQVVDVLAGRPPRWPVNVPALPAEDLELVRPFLELAESLGRLHAALLRGAPRTVDLDHQGSLPRERLRIVSGHFLVGLLGRIVDEPINYVNSPVIARERGIRVREGLGPDLWGGLPARRQAGSLPHGYSELVQTSVGEDSSVTTVAGALLDRSQARIVEMDGFGLDLTPRNFVVLVWNREPEKPGFVGTIGKVLGAAGINILSIQVGHEVVDAQGLMAVTVAEPVGAKVLDEVARLPGVARLVTVDFGG
jgi:D-3-phosphoglycerate dehydrogenase